MQSHLLAFLNFDFPRITSGTFKKDVTLKHLTGNRRQSTESKGKTCQPNAWLFFPLHVFKSMAAFYK